MTSVLIVEDQRMPRENMLPAVAAGTAAGPVPEAAAGAARLPGGAGGR